MASGALIQTLEGYHGHSRISAIAISEDLSYPLLVTGSSNHTLIVWDLLTLAVLTKLQEPLDHELVESNVLTEISCIHISEGLFPTILSSSYDKSIRIWDSKTGALLQILSDNSESIYSVLLGAYNNRLKIISAGADQHITLRSIESDLVDHVNSIEEIDLVELEDSLRIVGKFLIYWKLILKSNPKLSSFLLNRIQARYVFYCMLRAGKLNPNLIITNVSVLSFLLGYSLREIDLLRFDSFLTSTPIQFLLENRLCIGRAQEWIQIEQNMRRVIYFLSDSFQSTETLDSILSAVVHPGDGGSTTWDPLLACDEFGEIFRNLLMNSTRSHLKIVEFLQSEVRTSELYCP